MKKGFIGNIEELTINNDNFRKVIFTGKYNQVVLMSLIGKEDIGLEIHKDTDQFFRIEKGKGILILGNKKYKIKDDDAFVAPAGIQHNVINTSQTKPLKLYTIYSPPHHKHRLTQKNKPKNKEH